MSRNSMLTLVGLANTIELKRKSIFINMALNTLALAETDISYKLFDDSVLSEL